MPNCLEDENLFLSQSLRAQDGPYTRAGAMTKTVRQTILVLACVLATLGFATNSQVHEADDGLVGPSAMVAAAPSNLATSPGKVVRCVPTCKVNSLAEGVVFLTAPSRTVSQAYLATPNHPPEFLCFLRC